ncbi:MAG: porphobilinogen synthase [Rikenellaceae bacterium]|nr:porphobilinogen synthase [Rikenellaceae bacterium]
MKRFRQYRTSEEVRDKYADVILNPDDFIYPYFVVEGEGITDEISSMNGVFRFSIDRLIEDVRELMDYGVDKVLLFGVVNQNIKDERGSCGLHGDSIICKAVRDLKKELPELTVITDVCLCEYTSHGHCGLLHNKDVDNDSTLPLLAQMALSHALAGADVVAPSAMMDGQVEAIRTVLDENNLKTRILAYSAKYASSFYGPFRDAAASVPGFGDRKSYQMDYRTRDQGLEEIAADIEEGADMVMVKPAMSYLDIISKASEKFPDTKLAAYQVSGEYSMLMAGAANGYFDERRVFEETLTAIKRAGADYIISYYAKKFFKSNR